MRGLLDAAGAVPVDTSPARPPTPLGRAIARFGNAVPVPVLHACNTITRRRFGELQREAERADIRRNAEAARRSREDRMAMEEAMREWRW